MIVYCNKQHIHTHERVRHMCIDAFIAVWVHQYMFACVCVRVWKQCGTNIDSLTHTLNRTKRTHINVMRIDTLFGLILFLYDSLCVLFAERITNTRVHKIHVCLFVWVWVCVRASYVCPCTLWNMEYSIARSSTYIYFMYSFALH